ncbi:MAG: NAD/NADP octopine/nopaline dehydrogenase family protein [Synergistales bacterium]|nr:NAD/NADP octopine/nopaline dehydrogenase family protein [Synergistales bacterium]
MDKVTVLGGGNGGQAVSAFLSIQGMEVALFEHPDLEANLDGIKEKGGIQFEGPIIQDFARISLATSDIGKALSDSQMIIMIVPSYAQETMFRLALPFLDDGDIVFALPGNFSSLCFSRIAQEAGKKILFAEAATIPFACRITGPGKVYVGGLKKTFPVGCFPEKNNDLLRSRIRRYFPFNFSFVRSVMEAALSNGNLIVHPTTATLNAGWIESTGGSFSFYRQGMSESVCRVEEAIDMERLTVGKALGLNIPPFVDLINTWYDLNVSSIREFAATSSTHNNFGHDAPSSLKNRYVSEDIPFLMVPVMSLGNILGVECPMLESFVRIGSVINGTDYLEKGRNLKQLGLEGMTGEEIRNLAGLEL